MAVNKYFNHVSNIPERDLIHDLVEECIQLSGIDVFYMRSFALSDPNFDSLFGENRFERISDTYEIEMYLESMEMPFGGGDLYSKFGLQQNQTCVFQVSFRRFLDVVGVRPQEGDYIYIPIWQEDLSRGIDDVYRITYVTDSALQTTPAGTSPMFKITAERAKFSHERFATESLGTQEAVTSIEEPDGEIVNDSNAENDLLQTLGDSLIDFSETNPFGEP